MESARRREEGSGSLWQPSHMRSLGARELYTLLRVIPMKGSEAEFYFHGLSGPKARPFSCAQS